MSKKAKAGAAILGLGLLGVIGVVSYNAGRSKGRTELKAAVEMLKMIDDSIAQKQAGAAETIMPGSLDDLYKQRSELVKTVAALK